MKDQLEKNIVDYSAVKSITHLTVPESLTVVGLGGLGLWGAYQAVMLGVDNIFLFDGDIVSAIDLTKVPYEPQQIGCNKAAAAAELLGRLRPTCKITVYERHFEQTDFKLLSGSVLNAADDISVDQVLSEHCKNCETPYVSGVYGRNSVGVFDDLPKNLEISKSVPTTSSLCSVAAGLAVHSLFSDNSYSLLIDFDRGPSTIPDINIGLLAIEQISK